MFAIIASISNCNKLHWTAVKSRSIIHSSRNWERNSYNNILQPETSGIRANNFLYLEQMQSDHLVWLCSFMIIYFCVAWNATYYVI
jgi:hypothetical protein